MKDQLVEFSVGAMKVAPPATVAVASQMGQIAPQSVLIWLSIIYTVGLLVQLVVNNWSKWLSGLASAWRWLTGRAPSV